MSKKDIDTRIERDVERALYEQRERERDDIASPTFPIDPSEAPTVRINLHDECSAHAAGFTIEPIARYEAPTAHIRFQSPTVHAHVPLPYTSVPAIDSHARALDRFARVAEATFRKFAADGSVGRDGLDAALASALATEITAQAEQPNAPDFRIDMPGDGTFDITVNGERKRYTIHEPSLAIVSQGEPPSTPWRVVDSWDAVEGDCVRVWDIKGPPPFDGIRARDEHHAEDLVNALNATVKVPADESESAPTEVQIFPQGTPAPRRGFTLEPFDGTSMEFTIEPPVDKRDELIIECARLHMVLAVTHQDLRTVIHAMPGTDQQIAALASAEAMARWCLTDCPAPGPELTRDDIDAAKERWS